MDLQPLTSLDYVDTNTGEMVTSERFNAAQLSGDYSGLVPIDDDTGDYLYTTPNSSATAPSNSPPPPGYAWFYTIANDRVPVALSTIPDQFWATMSPAQINTGTNAAGPVAAAANPFAGIMAGGAMTWLLIGGAVWYFFMRK